MYAEIQQGDFRVIEFSPPAAADTRLRVPAASRCFDFKTLK